MIKRLSIEEIKMDSTISTKDLKSKLDKKQGITVVERAVSGPSEVPPKTKTPQTPQNEAKLGYTSPRREYRRL